MAMKEISHSHAHTCTKTVIFVGDENFSKNETDFFEEGQQR